MSAVTLNSSIINSARTIGPGIGGLLVASVGEGWCFLGNALSYVAVVIGLLMMKPEGSPKRPARHLRAGIVEAFNLDRKSTRLNSSHRCISYAVFCLKKKKKQGHTNKDHH